jgi:hypothetical protein
MIYSLEIESIDISTAFLQGLNFSEIVARAAELGHEVKEMRKVWLVPPANVWRHLRDLPNSGIKVEDGDITLFVLRLLKAMYGLVDGPLLFQLALLHFLCTQLRMTRSVHDDNYLFRSDEWSVEAIFVIHVDDVLLCATKAFLSWAKSQIEKRFGKLKGSALPFTYLGIDHIRLTPNHVFLHQEPYLMKLHPIALSSERKAQKTSALVPTEHTEFRSLLCSMLWLCLTRMDLVSEIVQLQQEMIHPLVSHVLELNSLLKKAVLNRTLNGLHFGQLRLPLRIVGIGDAGQASKRSLYAQEGKLTLLMSDYFEASGEWVSSDEALGLGGLAHPLFHSGKKATRVSHSTSHAEALSSIGTTQVAQLVANRMTEPFARIVLRSRGPSSSTKIDARALTIVQQNNLTVVPVDQVTDCMDLYELVCGHKGLSADKNQRLVITSLREDRARGFIRRFMHWPTSVMLADGLTKPGNFPQLNSFGTTGRVTVRLSSDKWIRTRTWQRGQEHDQEQNSCEAP